MLLQSARGVLKMVNIFNATSKVDILTTVAKFLAKKVNFIPKKFCKDLFKVGSPSIFFENLALSHFDLFSTFNVGSCLIYLQKTAFCLSNSKFCFYKNDIRS
jgi:hypothetical protein